MKKAQSGFTLVEIAIVLVIIGLLLGGVLKGQEMITNARVKNIVSQAQGVQAAFYAFQDRFRAIPGDLTAAQAAMVGNAALAAATAQSNSIIAAGDSATAFQNLTVSGFLSCPVCTVTGASTAANSPTNAYGGVMQLVTDAVYAGTVAAPATVRHNVKTGGQIPVEVIAEVDRKMDNGAAATGTLRQSTWNGGLAACMVTPAWAAPNVAANCGAAWFL